MRGEGLGPQNTVLLVDHRRDVQVLVGVNTPDDAANCSFLRIHDEPPGSTVINGFAKTDCMDRTVT